MVKPWHLQSTVAWNPESPSIKKLCWKVHESNYVKFESWKHINMNEPAYKLIQ